jgi:hypothetical protein
MQYVCLKDMNENPILKPHDKSNIRRDVGGIVDEVLKAPKKQDAS